jgi:hypothetical protein
MPPGSQANPDARNTGVRSASKIIIASRKFLLLPSGLCVIGVDQISHTLD